MGLLSRVAKTLIPGAVGAGAAYAVAPEDERAQWALAGGAGAAMAPLLAKYIDPTKMGTFGGQFAKTANKPMLGLAREMERVGATREAIWDNTGWFKGVDGKWRFEIDDSGARLTGVGKGSLGEVLDHPKLYEAYPDLALARAFRSKDEGGVYMAPSKYNDEAIKFGGNDADARSVVLHEAGGHGAQQREGFALGGQPNELDGPLVYAAGGREGREAIISRIKEIEAEMDAIAQSQDPHLETKAFKALDKEWVRLRSSLEPNAAAYEGYRRLAGEVEARNVQARMDFSPKERRARPPWTTQDVPDEQQIVKLGGLLSRVGR